MEQQKKEPVISFHNVTKILQSRTIIDNVSFDVYPGEIFVIMGCSGSGKSTLLRLMSGALKPDRGRIIIKGKDTAILSVLEREELKKKFGMCFQYSALLDSLTIEENIALPLKEHTHLTDEMVNIIIKMKLGLVGLRGFEHYYPSQISGGMRKRAGLARAIALDPEVVLYDEPTSGLDPIVGGVIDKLIKELCLKLRITSVVVTHDMQSVFEISDRVAMIHEGRVVAILPREELRSSANPMIQQFINGQPTGPIDFLNCKVEISQALGL